VYTQVDGGLAGRVRPERAVEPDLQEGVGEQGHQCGRHPGNPAKTLGDEPVERARILDVPGHRHVPRREYSQDHRYDQERRGDAD